MMNKYSIKYRDVKKIIVDMINDMIKEILFLTLTAQQL